MLFNFRIRSLRVVFIITVLIEFYVCMCPASMTILSPRVSTNDPLAGGGNYWINKPDCMLCGSVLSEKNRCLLPWEKGVSACRVDERDLEFSSSSCGKHRRSIVDV